LYMPGVDEICELQHISVLELSDLVIIEWAS
jgi:hypothetical protein